MAKRTVRVEDLLNGTDDDEAAADQYATAIEGLVTAPFAVVPGAPKKNRIAEIAEAAERKSRDVPITDRLGKSPKAERVAKATAPKVVVPKEPKAPKEMPLCQCGCGERTGGGKFLPGHDAKLKSRLFIEARSEDHNVAENALTELSKRSWLHLMGEKKVAKPKATPVGSDDVSRYKAIEANLQALGFHTAALAAVMRLIEAGMDERDEEGNVPSPVEDEPDAVVAVAS